MLQELFQDLRVGVRGLARQPAFTLAALLTLSLGIGANTAVFSVVNSVLLAPLPYRDAERVVVIWSRWRNFEKTWVSDAEIHDYQTKVAAFQRAAGWDVGQVNLTGDGEPVRIGSGAVTPNLFDMLGVRPVAGRTFTDAEALPDTPTAVILSYGLWQRRFAGANDIIGRTILVNGVARQVVGVMPRGFQLPTDFVQDAEEPTQIWTPLRLDPQNRGNHGLHAAARLKPGVTIGAANAELDALARRLTKAGLYPEAMQFRPFAVSAPDEAFGAVKPAILLLMGAVGFLLLIACANVANLLLVRAEGRAREMAIRSALGARRARLVRQMMTECAVLAAGAAALGVAFASVALRLMLSINLTAVPRADAIAMNASVLGFCLLLTAVTLLVFSLPPALRAARVDLTETIKEGAQTTTAGGVRQRMRGLLVIAETALAVVLLAGASLMLRSIWSLQKIDLGFNPRGVLTMRLAIPTSKYDSPEKIVAFYQQFLERVRALPGVASAGLIRSLPLAATIGDWSMTVEGYDPPPGTGTPGDWQVASDGAVEALGERIIRGRSFTRQDGIGAMNVALVNEAMARKYWASRDAVGGRFRMGGRTDRPWITVVGIVGNVRHNTVTETVKPKFYRPHAQFHQGIGFAPANMTLVVRSSGNPLMLADPLRAELQRMDPDVPAAAVRTMDEIVNASIATPRLTGWLLGLFAALALTLAAVGIYGVLSYVVSQRRREIGIRMAIGARPRQVVGLVMGEGVALAAIGAGLGIVIAAATTRVMTTLLQGVTPLDPVSFAAAPLLLLAVATLASLIPAWQATRVDPVKALRTE